MNIKPRTGKRNYAKGGEVVEVEKTPAEIAMEHSGGLGSFRGVKSAFVDPNKYPGWPQMAGLDGPKVSGGGGGGE
jgi:hypothetical protein